jgi:Flp pilus assembly protein TadD
VETVETDWKMVSTAFHKRGLDQARKREYDEAIDDFTQAIRFNPKVADYINDRGNVWAAKGEPEKASADYRQAELLKKKP